MQINNQCPGFAFGINLRIGELARSYSRDAPGYRLPHLEQTRRIRALRATEDCGIAPALRGPVFPRRDAEFCGTAARVLKGSKPGAERSILIEVLLQGRASVPGGDAEFLRISSGRDCDMGVCGGGRTEDARGGGRGMRAGGVVEASLAGWVWTRRVSGEFFLKPAGGRDFALVFCDGIRTEDARGTAAECGFGAAAA